MRVSRETQAARAEEHTDSCTRDAEYARAELIHGTHPRLR